MMVQGSPESPLYFYPKVLALNFKTANAFAGSQMADKPRGVWPIEYNDDDRLGGKYTLWVKVERL